MLTLPKMIQKLTFIRIGRYELARWTSYIDTANLLEFLIICKKSCKNQLSYVKMLNICST